MFRNHRNQNRKIDASGYWSFANVCQHYDRIEKNDNENSTIGILLYANKNDGVVKFSLRENNQNIIASQYKLYLPTEKQLLEEVKKELENFEEDKNQK
jgi:MFS superfamily sulfate permease-like transporter